MSYIPKPFLDIVADMIEHVRGSTDKLTDFNVGSVTRTLLESAAIELEEYYLSAHQGLISAIPEAVFNTFDFPRLQAAYSTGNVLVTITAQAVDTLISAGALFTASNGSVFAANEDVTIATGDTTADVLVTATTAGFASNIPLSSTFTIAPTVTGLVSAAATSGFQDGRDLETLDEQRARFRDYIASLPRATVDALTYGAATAIIYDTDGFILERIQHSKIIEPYLTDPYAPPGLINLYLYSGVTDVGTPTKGCTADMLALVEDVIDGYVADDGTRVPGWKAAGTKVMYYACDLVDVDIEGTVTIDSSYTASDVLDAVETAMETYLNSLPLGGDVIHAELVAAAMGVPGVVDIALSDPTTNTTITDIQKAVIGAVDLSEAP